MGSSFRPMLSSLFEGVREDVCCFLRSEQFSERLSTQEAGCLASQLWAQMSGASWGHRAGPQQTHKKHLPGSLEAAGPPARREAEGNLEDACGPASPCLPSQAFPEFPQGASFPGTGVP